MDVVRIEVREIVVWPICRSQVNLKSSVTPRYLTELAVGTRTSFMYLCTWSVFREYVNCTIWDLSKHKKKNPIDGVD